MYKQILLLALIGLSLQVKLIRKINFKNNCQDTVWVGGFAVPLPPSTGWEMKTGREFSMPVSGSSVAARFWARTDCKWVGDKFQCSTGDCGTPMNNFGIECKGITGQAPATLVEFTLSTSGAPDFYDMSNVDGYNIPVYFGPTPGSFSYVDNPDLGKFNCGSPSCNLDTSRCPRELQFKGASGRTYCYSICAAIYNNEQVQNNKDILGPIASDPMKRDLVCCACGEGTGGCTDPSSHFCCSPLDPRSGIGGRCYVQNWPKPSSNFDRYDKVFKDQCGDAYSWQFDDMQSTYQCMDADYDVVFCPKKASEW